MTVKSSRSAPEEKSLKRIDVTITYLEQTERPILPQPPLPRRKVALLRAENMPVHFYRYLYRLVGDPCHWVSRRRMSDEKLVEIIHHPDVYIYVLYADGSPAGMAEIDARNAGAHELKFFGLAPDFTGSGLGRYFLTHIVDLAWLRGPKKLLLETCTLDHPAALPLYQKFGFKVSGRRDGVVELMEQPAAAH